MDWFRWHHGTVSDPKWRVVAAEAGVRVVDVVGVWAAMLEHASENDPRGSVEGWHDRVVAIALDLPVASVLAIRQAMQGLTIEGDELPSWNKRQPKREDDSAPRVRAHRERLKRTVTQRNAREIEREIDRTEEKEERTGVLVLHAGDPLEKSIDEIVIAANRGMIDNPLIGDACHPISISHGSRQNVHDWLAEGIPAEVAKLAVYQRAKEWKPDSRRRQITTLAYFDGAVRDEADKHRAKSGEAPSAKAPGVDRSEVGEWKRANPAELADIERQENERLEQNDTYARTSAGVRRTMLQDAVKAAVQARIRAAAAVA